MKILIINGANLNLLGIRNPEIYGNDTYEDLCDMIRAHAYELGVDVEICQSNHEGDIVDKIQEAYEDADAIIINAGAYTHYSYAIRDAIEAVAIRTVEVHISDIYSREDFRAKSVLTEVCEHSIVGKGLAGYIEAMDYLG